jgi:voltage-gated potassium channel Kch
MPTEQEWVRPDEARHEAIGLRSRVRYRFDNLLARGMWAVLLWLGLITLLAVVLSSALLALSGVSFAGSEDSSLIEDFWQSMLRILDPGTMAADVGWGRRLLALLVTVIGILIAGTLIGLIASGVEQRVEAMRRGRSVVTESGHVVVLGGSSRLVDVVDQLVLANRGKRNQAIVVLSDNDPTELAERVRLEIPDLLGTRLVVRRGDPTSIAALSIAAVRRARAVVVLGEDDDTRDGRAVMTTLAAGAAIGGFDRLPIVVNVDDPTTADHLVQACGPDVHPVVARQAVARTMAFALRQPGLNQVVAELLDLRGADIHIRDLGDLAGAPFGQSITWFVDARPIGRLRGDGRPELNPPPSTLLEPGDRIILLANDARPPQRLSAPGPNSVGPSGEGPGSLEPQGPREEHVLIVGWNRLGTELLVELDGFCAPQSTCTVVYDAAVLDPSEVGIPELFRLDVDCHPSGPAWPLEPHAMGNVSAVVLLGYSDVLPSRESDSRTLLNLMSLRRQFASWTEDRPRVIVELQESESVDIAQVSGADDYVVSSGIASRSIAQLAEQPERRAVFQALYALEGPSIRLVPASQYGLRGEVPWLDVVSAVYATGAIAIGWRPATDTGVDSRLNPRLTERVRLDDDQIVVIA